MELYNLFAEHGIGAVILALIGSVVGGVFSALLTSSITYRHEKMLSNRTNALKTYDSCLELVGLFRQDPSLALNKEYLVKVMGASVKVGAYCGHDVYDAMSKYLKQLNQIYSQFESEKQKEINQYWDEPHIELDPSTGEEVLVGGGPTIDQIKIENIIESLRKQIIPSNLKAKQYCDPVVEAISKSLKPIASTRGF